MGGVRSRARADRPPRGCAPAPAVRSPYGPEHGGPHLRPAPPDSLFSGVRSARGRADAGGDALERDVCAGGTAPHYGDVPAGNGAFRDRGGHAVAHGRRQGAVDHTGIRPGTAEYHVHVRHRHRRTAHDDHGVPRAPVSVLAGLVRRDRAGLHVRHGHRPERKRLRAAASAGEASPADAPGFDLGRRRERPAPAQPRPAGQGSGVRRAPVAGGAGGRGHRRDPAGAHGRKAFRRLLEPDPAVPSGHAARAPKRTVHVGDPEFPECGGRDAGAHGFRARCLCGGGSLCLRAS